MRLGAWLSEQKITQEAFGETIGRTQGRVSQLVNGSWPSSEEAERILVATGGAVSLESFLPEREPLQ